MWRLDEGFDGGIVNNPITIRDKYLKLYNYQADANTAAQTDKVYSWSVRDWFFGGDKIDNEPTEKPPGADELINIGLRLDNAPNGAFWNNLHNIVLFGSANASGTPALGVSKHFFIRGDFIVRGPLKSREGIIILHGNGINQDTMGPATPRDYKTGWNIGWGPRTGTPFVYLAEGGDHMNGQGGNPDAETLLIVTNRSTPNISDPPLDSNFTSNAYKWGHLEAGKITSHDMVLTNLIGPVVPRYYLNHQNELQAFFFFF